MLVDGLEICGYCSGSKDCCKSVFGVLVFFQATTVVSLTADSCKWDVCLAGKCSILAATLFVQWSHPS